MVQKIPLNFGWEFTERFDEAFLAGEPAQTAAVDLPHTVREVPYNGFDEKLYQLDSGYRRKITVPEEWNGKRVFLHVGAAGHRAEVYVDGKMLAVHSCGYTSFKVELTESLGAGEHLLCIRCDSRESLDQPPFGFVIDYLTFGGLYRGVWLEIKEQSYIEEVFVLPEAPKDAGSTGMFFTGIVNSQVKISGEGQIRQYVTLPGSDERLGEGGDRLEVKNARLWDVDSPNLYLLTTELVQGEEVVDRVETTFGFRRAEFKKDGFYLNGRKLRLRGLNRHQSYPYVGYAMPESVQRFDADILKKELGLNAVRTSHYPQSQGFVDRCDELGLLVFTEIPGWQHIGGEEWKNQAVRNTEEMVTQYRNHPSVILWGVRINESQDDDGLYRRTNAAAHALDPTRQTSGVRYLEKSSLLEDVYAFNDFSHEGDNPGCKKKKAVTPDRKKGYFISEYNGHMFPTKPFDCENHRLEHALRHACVLDAVAGEKDIAGSFGWCMFDYNTHKDFGSGDRICYHGVTDMFRNHKLAAAVYSSQQDETPVLEVSSSMDIGEHPAGKRERLFVFTNADEVRMYKNGRFIRSFTHADSPYRNMSRPPIEIDDYIGGQIEENEPFSKKQARYVKDLLNYATRFGFSKLPFKIKLKAAWLMLRYRMTFQDAYDLNGKYLGNWGDSATEYRFDAIKEGKVVKSVIKTPSTDFALRVQASSTALSERETYDAALVRIAITDKNGNAAPYMQEAVRFETRGAVELIGPAVTVLRGGMGGTFVRTKGESGEGALVIRTDRTEPVRIGFTVIKQ